MPALNKPTYMRNQYLLGRDQVWGPRLILATGCSPELLAPAWSYMRVRALAAPAVLVVMVAQVTHVFQPSCL